MNIWQTFIQNFMKVANVKFPVLSYSISLWQMFCFFLGAEMALKLVFGIIGRKKEGSDDE